MKAKTENKSFIRAGHAGIEAAAWRNAGLVYGNDT